MSSRRDLSAPKDRTRYSYSTIGHIVPTEPLRVGHERRSACRTAPRSSPPSSATWRRAARRRGEDDPTVVAAYEDLADAFEAYDDALSTPTAR